MIGNKVVVIIDGGKVTGVLADNFDTELMVVNVGDISMNKPHIYTIFTPEIVVDADKGREEFLGPRVVYIQERERTRPQTV